MGISKRFEREKIIQRTRNFITMIKSEIKEGIFVHDSWYPEKGSGKIIAVKKTIIHVKFKEELIRYDYPHARIFLVKGRVKKQKYEN